MADEAPHEVAPSPDGSAKKELTMDQLKTYVHKARAKIRRLEEYNQSLSTKVGELEGAQQSASASADGADQGLLSSLREEAELWKIKYQEQVEAIATAPNGDAVHGRLAAVEEELEQTKAASERAQQSLKTEYEEQSQRLQGVVVSLRQQGATHDETARQAKQAQQAELTAMQKASAELESQVEELLRDSGVLEHRLVCAQQERDEATARYSGLEEEMQRVRADARDAIDGEVGRLEAEKESLRQKLELEQALAKALTASEELRSELEGVQATSDESRRELVAHSAKERDEVVAELADARAELEVFESRTQAVATNVAAVERERDEAAAEALALKSELEGLRGELEVFESRADGAAAGIIAVESEKAEALSKLLAATAEMKAVERERDEAAAKVLAVEDEMGGLKDTLEALESRAEGAAGDLVAVEKERDEAVAKSVRLESELGGVRAELEREKAAVAEGEREREEAAKEKGQAETEAGSAEASTAGGEEVAPSSTAAAALLQQKFGVERDALSARLVESEAARSTAEEEAVGGRAVVEGQGTGVRREWVAGVRWVGGEAGRVGGWGGEWRWVNGLRVTEREHGGLGWAGGAEGLEEQLNDMRKSLAGASISLEARDAKDDARAQGGATDAEGETTETVENGGLVETVGATEAARTADAGPISSSLSEKTALLQARCDELEVEATAAAEKIAVLETKLNDRVAAAAAAAATGAVDATLEPISNGDGNLDEIARPAARETAAVAAAGEAQEEGASGALEVTPEVISDSERGEGSKGGGGVEEATAAAAAEEASRVQEMLENRLREAKASATGFKEALQEMEGVVAGLREEEAVLKARLLEVAAEATAAEENASRAQETLLAEKDAVQEAVQSATERADTAEKLSKELQESMQAMTTEGAESAGKRSIELQEVVQLANERAAVVQSATERADSAEKMSKELQEAVQFAREEAEAAEKRSEELEKAVQSANERADSAEKLSMEVQENMQAVATETGGVSEALRLEKVALESQLQEARLETASSQQALAEAVSAAASAEEAAEARVRTESERCSQLEGRVASQKEKLGKAVTRLRSLREEKETVTADLASASSLLETSQKNLAEAEARCRFLEASVGDQEAAAAAARDDASERTSHAGERVSALEEAAASLREELAAATRGLREAEERTRDALEEAARSRAEADGRRARLEEAQEALRLAEQRNTRVPALEADLEAERAGRRELEGALEAVESKARDAEGLAQETARGGEEIMKALYGQVDASNKVEELTSKLTAADAARKEREDEFAQSTADKEQALLAEKTAREEVEVKVKRLKSLLSKLQKSSHGKDADIAALKAPAPPPPAFTVDLRVRHEGSVWCLIQADPSAKQASSGTGEGRAASKNGPKEEEGKKWVTEDKARAWLAGGSSSSDDTHWPSVIQDIFEEKVSTATEEARRAKGEAVSTRAELQALSSDFSKYKARAHTALKKATSSGADDKRKDEMIAGLESERERLTAEMAETVGSLEGQLSDAKRVSKAREEDLEAASQELETAQEAEDGHSEEMSTLRDAREELKSQLKAAKAQANENSSIAQRLKEELESLAKEREGGERRGSGSWNPRSDGGWAVLRRGCRRGEGPASARGKICPGETIMLAQT
eukprot:jgi/Undpi1/9771/HiC_scaffold_27.g12227.m1